MRFLKLYLIPLFISAVVVLSSVNAYASLSNKNVFAGFFHQKGAPASKKISKSFTSVFNAYLNSKKPYFVLAYTSLKKKPYFNFDRNMNLVEIKKLGIAYQSNYIITGSIAKFGSHYNIHAMLINVKNVYDSKTLKYTGEGKKSLEKNIHALSRKVSLLISSGIKAKAAKNSIPVSKEIYAIQIKGNVRVGAGFITNKITVKRGGYYSAKEIDKSVKALYKTGYFKDVTVNVRPVSHGLILTFIVSERPYIKYIKYSGNGSVSVKKIKKMINLKVDSPYSSYDIHKASKMLEFIYSAEGYYNAKVTVKKKVFPGNYVGIHFVINENLPVMVRKVKFEGNSSFSSAKLQSVLDIKTVGLLTWITGEGKFKKAKLNNQIIALLSFYYNHGYISVRVKKPIFVFSKNKKYVTIIVRIVQGPQYKISTVNLEIKHVKKSSKEYAFVKKLIITKEGDIFNRKYIEKEILAITKFYTNGGYAFVNVEPSIKIRSKTNSVLIKLVVNKGKIARFGKISITGNTMTYSYVILRALRLYPGEIYNPKLIKISRQALKNLRYFKHVAITTEKVPNTNILDVKINVKEGNTGKFTIGGGYSSATSFMAISSVSEANLFGTGISASLNIQIGGPYQSYSFNILQPYLTYVFNRPLSLNLSLYNTFNSLYSEFAYRSVGGSVTLGYPLYGRMLTEYVKYLLDENTSVIEPGLSNILSQGALITSEVSLTTVYNTLNDSMNPTSGDLDSIKISFAGHPIGGNNNFIKVLLHLNHYIPLWGGTSLMEGAQAGYITSTSSSAALPIYQRFFVGGITNVYPLLGFMYDSVGPTQNGLLVGGTKMLTVQAKYLVPIMKSAGLYGFLWWNAGNAWEHGQSVFPLNLEQAVGVGINWDSPFGPIVMTYGKILGTPTHGNSPTKMQFSLGEGFPGI